ncbi:MAG: hypothetical protein ACT4NY_23100 [Pseudonocardiales bacterium]
MTDQLAFRLQTPQDDLVRAVELLGWGGTVLPELTLFGCRVVPVVALDTEVHDARQSSGYGPQRDHDVLEIWDWPQAADHVPATPLSLSGMLVRAGTWRGGLAVARTWRGFGPAAVLTGSDHTDETCLLEFQLSGVGLITIDTVGSRALQVAPAAGRLPPARRRVLDRWVEETLYEHALTTDAHSRRRLAVQTRGGGGGRKNPPPTTRGGGKNRAPGG